MAIVSGFKLGDPISIEFTRLVMQKKGLITYKSCPSGPLHRKKNKSKIELSLRGGTLSNLPSQLSLFKKIIMTHMAQ